MSRKSSSNPLFIKELTIKNFKGIDKLQIDFPTPILESDPNILVIGSKNGIGKTSILECISLSFLSLIHGRDFSQMRPAKNDYTSNLAIDIFDLFIRSSEENCEIQSIFSDHKKDFKSKITIYRSGKIEVNSDEPDIAKEYRRNFRVSSENILHSIFGLFPEPIILPNFMYFHSYRKIQEGNPEMGMMFDEYTDRFRRVRNSYMPISVFKLEILRSMMSRGGLFENIEDEDADSILEKLNDLMSSYAHGKIEKLRPSSNNTLEFRITPDKAGPSFSFDGLSSGQKEAISTLFLIWKYSTQLPSIVLIDEPEMHLNMEWHSKFSRDLFKLAPRNQYIIATHSEQIFESTDKSMRLMLSEE